jgi:hypothetical protein
MSMSKIIYDDQQFDMEELRQRMDEDLVREIQEGTETDQDFFNAYLIAHNEKYGERFVVD